MGPLGISYSFKNKHKSVIASIKRVKNLKKGEKRGGRRKSKGSRGREKGE